MRGELFINGYDAWLKWGITMNTTSLSTLLTPASMKDYPKNSVRIEHGTRYITNNVKQAERDLSLQIDLVASGMTDFMSKYEAFCAQLATGKVNIKTKYQPNVTYKCLYISCTQYSMRSGKVGKFTLKLKEPNPNDRS